jgi:hypothetical protein
MVAAVIAWGSVRIRGGELTRSGQPIRVGLIQGNVDQGQKWDTARSAAIFEDYLNKTREAIGRGAALVIWPESSTPFRFEEDSAGAAQIRTLARQTGVSIIFGSDHVEWRVAGASRLPEKAFNSAFLVRPNGTTGGTYRKMHLVPWGEYVPLKDLLFFVGPLVEAIGTGFEAFHHTFLGVLRRQQENVGVRVGPQLPQGSADVDAVLAGHHPIEQGHARGIRRFQHFPSGVAILGRNHAVSPLREQGLKHAARDRFVIGD